MATHRELGDPLPPDALPLLITLVGEGVVVLDEQERVRFASPPVARFLGVDRVPADLERSIHPDDRAALWAAVREGGRVRVRAQRPDGTWASLHLRSTDLRHVPLVAGWVLVVRDISEEVAAREQLAVALGRYRTLVEQAQGGMLVVDRDFRVALANPKTAELLGETVESMTGRPFTDWVFEEDADDFAQRAERRRAGVSEQYEYRLRRSDGEPVSVLIATNALHDADGRFDGALAVLTDLSERKRAEAALVERSLLDPLTDLPNRRAVHLAVNAAVAHSARHGGAVAVLYLDLNGFKSVNDGHGHGVGDDVLRQVAMRLRQAVRQEDVVARLGGDEFVVIGEVARGLGDALQVARQVRDAVLSPVPVGQRLFQVSVSVGVALAGPDDDTEALLAAADRAMYAAKRSGSSGVGIAPPAPGADPVVLPYPA